MSGEIQIKITKLTEKLSDCISGFEVIKLYPNSHHVIDRYLEENDTVAKNLVLRTKKLSMMDMLTFIAGFLSSIGTILVGILLVSRGKADYGTIMAIVSLQFGVSMMFQELGGSITRLTISMAKAERIFEFLDIEEEHKCKKAKKTINGVMNETKLKCLEFIEASYKYANRGPLFHNLSFHINVKDKIAVVGESGCGKSSILKLLLQFYNIEDGIIRLNGKAIEEYSINEWRNNFAYVPQDSYLFEGTIIENIQLGRRDATKEEIVHAAKLAFAHDFILDLPNGYEMNVTTGGRNLSGGQRQRIAIARAFLKNAPIILLDEATSALDTESEQQVIAALHNLMKDKTVIMVSHKVQSIDFCNRIFQLKDGAVA